MCHKHAAERLPTPVGVSCYHWRQVNELFQCIKSPNHVLNKLLHERHLQDITNYRSVYQFKIPLTKHLRSR